MTMADTNNHLNNFNKESLDINHAVHDYATDSNEQNDDILTSTLLESKYYDMESLITYMNYEKMIIIK